MPMIFRGLSLFGRKFQKPFQLFCKIGGKCYCWMVRSVCIGLINPIPVCCVWVTWVQLSQCDNLMFVQCESRPWCTLRRGSFRDLHTIPHKSPTRPRPWTHSHPNASCEHSQMQVKRTFACDWVIYLRGLFFDQYYLFGLTWISITRLSDLFNRFIFWLVLFVWAYLNKHYPIWLWLFVAYLNKHYLIGSWLLVSWLPVSKSCTKFEAKNCGQRYR